MCTQKTFKMRCTAIWVQYGMLSLVSDGIEANAAFGATIKSDGVRRSCEAHLCPTLRVMSLRSHLEAYMAFFDNEKWVYAKGIILLKRILGRDCPRDCHGDVADCWK